MTEHNYKNFSDLEDRLIMPVVRAAFIRTANLMSAQESYSAKRADFINWTWDQVENGLYKTEEVVTEIPRQDDPTKMEKKRVRTIIYGKDGEPLREKNPLFGTGIKLSNFEVKSFEYDPIVVKQIADQQQNFMAIETAKAQAERAKQDAIKAEEEGKAEAAKAKWGQEKINAQEIAQAEKNKEVAELIASQQLEVSKLEKQAAEQTKQKEILIGEGEATRKKLVMNADGALELKLKAQVEIEKNWADAFARRAVPTTYIAGASSGAGSSSDVDSKLFQTLVNSKIAGDIANIKPNKQQ
jgi:regulator of protease activity HflC (stomatin/prohibitin superfamily)